MNKVLTSIALIFLTPIYAIAANWEYIGKDIEGGTYSIDKDSVSSSNKYTKAWFQTEYETPKRTGSYPALEYSTDKSLYYFDCAARTNALVSIIKYAPKSGEVVESRSIDVKTARFDEVAPDTVGEAQLKEACKRVKRSK